MLGGKPDRAEIDTAASGVSMKLTQEISRAATELRNAKSDTPFAARGARMDMGGMHLWHLLPVHMVFLWDHGL